jgi:hypothetical protein
MEMIAALAPTLTDTLIRWTQAAGTYLTGTAATGTKRRARKPSKRKA